MRAEMIGPDEPADNGRADAEEIGRRRARLAILRRAGLRYRLVRAEDAAEAAERRENDTRELYEAPDAHTLGVSTGRKGRRS
jgi:hypothetical protein